MAPTAPRERQRLELPEGTLRDLREWAVEGSGITASARVLDPDDRIALVENEWTERWFPPGGAVESGEKPRMAARREVREETGLDAEVGAPLVVVDQTYVDRDGTEWFRAYQVLYDATADGEIPDAPELGVAGESILAARWFERLPDRLHDGELFRPYLRCGPQP